MTDDASVSSITFGGVFSIKPRRPYDMLMIEHIPACGVSYIHTKK